MKNNERGFTMVEFAIVMIIIGLMVGGVFVGRTMLHNARVTGTVQQIISYNVAVGSFVDTYEDLPGDFMEATTRLPGCAGAGCVNGNGNGVIGVADFAWQAVDMAISSENTQFWKHLAAARLIDSVNAAATTVAWGETHPVSKYNGGFLVREGNNVSTSLPSGPLYIMRSSINGIFLGGGYAGAISPFAAANIDRKTDDGMAFTGNTQSLASSHTDGCGYANTANQGANGYDEDLTRPACDMMIKMKPL